MTAYELNEANVVKVFELLKRNVGGMRILFGSTGMRVHHPGLKEIYEELVEYFAFTDAADRTALLYILSKARTKGMEQVEFYNFAQMLKRPCPKVPVNGDKPFLPYLSFLCAPSKAPFPRHDHNDGVKRYVPGQDEYPSIVPPIPKGVAAPPPSKRETLVELKAALAQCGSNVTLVQLVRALHEVDPYVDPQRVREVFEQAEEKTEGRRSDRPVASVAKLLALMAPHLTMNRQKSHSSAMVRETMTWPQQCVSPAMLVAPTEATVPRGSKATISPRTHRSTKSSDLLASYTRSAQDDPTSPRYHGQYNPLPSPRRIHIPTSEEFIRRQEEAMAKSSGTPRAHKTDAVATPTS